MPGRVRWWTLILASVAYLVAALVLLAYLSQHLRWNFLIPVVTVLAVVWAVFLDRPFREALNRGRDLRKLADHLDSDRPCILLLRPFRDEKQLSTAIPAPHAPGDIEPPFAELYEELRGAIADTVDLVALKNDAAQVGTKGMELFLVPDRLWQQTVAIASEGADRIAVVLSSTGAGDSLRWELSLLESRPALRAKTTILRQPHGWLQAYEKKKKKATTATKASHEAAVPLELLDVVRPAAMAFLPRDPDVSNWPGNVSSWQAEDEQFWERMGVEFPILSARSVPDVISLAQRLMEELDEPRAGEP